jgi:hypothetical protein
MKKYGLYVLTFAVFLTQIPSNRACYAKMDFLMHWCCRQKAIFTRKNSAMVLESTFHNYFDAGIITSINVPLTYKIIGPGSKDPVLTLRISNTQEKVRHVEPRKRNRTMRILNENANGKTQSL